MGPTPWAEFGDGLDVMALNEAFTAPSVMSLKVEAAYLAMQSPILLFELSTLRVDKITTSFTH